VINSVLTLVLVVHNRPAFEDLSHNSSLEAAGFVCLFLPSTLGRHGTETGLLTKCVLTAENKQR
jgi:hypothetical protein